MPWYNLNKVYGVLDKGDEHIKRLPKPVQAVVQGIVLIGVDRSMLGPPGDNMAIYTAGGGEPYPGSLLKWLSNFYFTRPIECISQYGPLVMDKLKCVPQVAQQFCCYRIPEVAQQFSSNFQMLVNRLFELF